jgi:RpiR family carbohydrate utilization transcriptional regulator
LKVGCVDTVERGKIPGIVQPYIHFHDILQSAAGLREDGNDALDAMVGFSNDTSRDDVTVGVNGDLPRHEDKAVGHSGLAKRQALSARTGLGGANAFDGQEASPLDASWANPRTMIYQKCSIVKQKCSSNDILRGGLIEIPGQHQEDGVMSKARSSDSGDILPRLEGMMDAMTRSEVRIARQILAAPDDFVRSSVRSVAADLGVSEPTILRFCRTVGCDGFKDLKFRLIQELALSQANSDRAERATKAVSSAGRGAVAARGTAQKSPDDDRLFDTIIEALTRTRATLVHADVLRSAQAIAQAGRVVVYGIGGSSAALASEAHNRLFRLNVPVMVFTDGYTQRMSAAILAEGDVALFISSTGRPRELQESLELAKYCKATCIAITDKETPLGRDAEICLHVGLGASGIEEIQPNPMRFAQLFVIDRLAYAVAANLGEQAHLSLRKMRGSVAWLHGINPQQPIGD